MTVYKYIDVNDSLVLDPPYVSTYGLDRFTVLWMQACSHITEHLYNYYPT